jgi:hypothetical protein
MGWFNIEMDGNKQPLDNPVPPSIRQIAYETLLTLGRFNIEKESRVK